MSWDSSHVRRLLSRWDYPAEAVDTLGRAMESAMGHPRTRALLDGASEAYGAGAELDMEGVLAQISDMAADCGEHPFTMQLLPYLRMLESAERRYAAVGISQEIYEATFADLLCKARECRRVYGVWGSFVASWFTGFFELKRFALGRLQFEFSSFEADEPLPRGERVINVHIPARTARTHTSALLASSVTRMKKRRLLSVIPGCCTRCALSWEIAPGYVNSPRTTSCCTP